MRLIDAFSIRTKEGKKLTYKRNKAQADFASKRGKRNIVLKSRQQGITTDMQLSHLEKAMYYPYITCCTIAHRKKKAEDIFKIAQFAFDNLPIEVKQLWKLRSYTVRELRFDNNNSSYFVDVDARSQTVTHLHVSEVAFIRDFESLVAGTFETVPENGTINLESTANGWNFFYDLWNEAKKGKNEFQPFFYDWTWGENYKIDKLPIQEDWKEEYKELARKYDLILDIKNVLNITDNQWFWYYNKVRRLKKLIKQEYPCTDDEAFLSSSGSVFDLFLVEQIVTKKPIEYHKGVEIYYKPQEGHKYVVGIDTSEGVENDFTSLEVWDDTDKKEVASYQDNTIRPDQVAILAIDIARMFNNALIIPEKNSSGLSTLLKIQEVGYDNLYVRVIEDAITKVTSREYGWRTTSGNRDLMIDDFQGQFEDGEVEINSANVKNQLKTFVRKKNGRREHDEGKHDDNLFAIFLCLQGAKYLGGTRTFTSKPSGW